MSYVKESDNLIKIDESLDLKFWTGKIGPSEKAALANCCFYYGFDSKASGD